LIVEDKSKSDYVNVIGSKNQSKEKLCYISMSMSIITILMFQDTSRSTICVYRKKSYTTSLCLSLSWSLKIQGTPLMCVNKELKAKKVMLYFYYY